MLSGPLLPLSSNPFSTDTVFEGGNGHHDRKEKLGRMRVAVIGGGPAGLVTLKYLLQAHVFFPDIEPIEAKLFEASSSALSDMDMESTHDDGAIYSRKSSTFSDCRIPSALDSMSTDEYREYLQIYCQLFGLGKHIVTNAHVTEIMPNAVHGHVVNYEIGKEQKTWECNAIAICASAWEQLNLPDDKKLDFSRGALAHHDTKFLIGSSEKSAHPLACYDAKVDEQLADPEGPLYTANHSRSFDFLDQAYPSPWDADVQRIWSTRDPSVAYIGFFCTDRGKIPPLAELQAQLWMLEILRRWSVTLPDECCRGMHAELQNFTQYHVDYDRYTLQLARDIGAVPTFSQLLRLGWKTSFGWMMSSNVSSKLRLVGPWGWDGAQDVMEGEIWDIVARPTFIFDRIVTVFASIARRLIGTVNWILLMVENVLVILLVLFGYAIYVTGRSLGVSLKRIKT